MYGALLPRSICNASRVIAPTRAVANEIEKRFPTARVAVVPLGLEPIFFTPPNTPDLERARARYGLPDNYLLFVGNFEPKKNLQTLLSALELLPDAPPLIIAGGNRAWPGHDAESTPAGSTPKAPTVKTKTIGYVSRADLPALYAGCAAFVFPSLAEGFGLPVLEALACGAPVVTSTKVPLPDLKHVAQICDPQSAEEIAASIKRALKNEEEITRLKTAGQEYARAFTWRRAARETLAVYSFIGGR